ncbi:hypothetical protein CXB51_021159 [Gossypium anomalum]|uniref:Protein kinase domain-containing protein n=1 Tax=Gossypium anomalum TaxID=47600 RepID=A0A8J6CRS9_9ROSI|nr:hypothetical protein CXB51_021159 [Gossypium anomalum]
MMGCICCKTSAIEDSKDSPIDRPSSKASLDVRVSRATSSRMEEAYREKDQCDNNDVRTMFIDKQVNVSVLLHCQILDRKREKLDFIASQQPRLGTVLKATEGEQVAAGRPAWLAVVAGEAIRGWIPWRADLFEKMDKIGQGTYTSVYRARDLDQKKVVALKKVRFDNHDPESVRFMAREIHILRRLDHPNVVKLEGLCYMHQLLRGLDHCHGRGVLHQDIKGPNLLIENNGILKIADFGLASFYDLNRSQPFTSRVVTLWYRPPELLLGAICYGTAVDLWSTGCILAELYAGKPIMPGRTEVEQLHKIFKLCGSPSEDYWRKSNSLQPNLFPVILQACQSILQAKSLMQRKGTLKLEGANKLLLLVSTDKEQQEPNGQKPELDRRTTRESQAIPAPDANAELVSSMQRRQGQPDSKSQSEKFSPHPEEVASVFPIDPSRPSQAVASNADADGNRQKRASHSGPLAHRAAWMNSGNNLDDAPKFSTGATDLSMMSSLVAARRSNLVSEDHKEKSQNHNVQQKEYGRSNNKDAVPLGYGSKGNKLHYSSPLLVPSSSNTDQFLKDHNHQIREAVRRAGLDKAKMNDQISTNPLFVSGR